MKIMIVSHGFPPEEMTGTELDAYRLSLALRARGHEVFPVVARESLERHAAGIVSTRVRGLEVRHLFTPRRPRSLIDDANREDAVFVMQTVAAELRPDVVLVNHLIRFSIAGLDPFFLLGIPVVMHFGDYWMACPRGNLLKNGLTWCSPPNDPPACAKCAPELLEPGVSRRLSEIPFALRRRRACEASDRVAAWIFPSRHLAGRHHDMGLSTRNHAVIPYAVPRRVDIEPVMPTDFQAAMKIGFFGVLSEMKGFRLLVDAIENLPGVELHAHGPIENPSLLIDRPNVIIHGPYRDEEVELLMRRVDLVAIPSIWEEGFGMVVQHALHARRPLLISRAGGLVEQMPADYPFLLPPGAIAAWRAAIEAMKDPALRRATTNALPAPNDFDVYVARVESVLEGAVHGKTAR